MVKQGAFLACCGAACYGIAGEGLILPVALDIICQGGLTLTGQVLLIGVTDYGGCCLNGGVEGFGYAGLVTLTACIAITALGSAIAAPL